MVNKEIHNPKLIVDDFDILAVSIKTQLKYTNRDPDWRVVFPYRNVYFDIWEAQSFNYPRYIIIAIAKSLISTHLRFNQGEFLISFWNKFPDTLKEIMDIMLVTEVQST